MSRAPFPDNSNGEPAARRHTVSRLRLAAARAALLFVVAASPLLAFAAFRTPPPQTGKIPAEQLPQRQRDQQTKPPERQRPPQALVCPNIVVRCPPRIDAGRPLPFTARLTRKGTPARKEDYRWTFSAGNERILEQRRDGDTHGIVVGTDKLDGKPVSATFEVAGYGPGCKNSCETFVAQRPTPTPAITPTPKPTATPRPTPKQTPTQTQTPSPTPERTPSPTPTPLLPSNTNPAGGATTPTPPTPTPDASPSPTPLASPSPLPSATTPVVVSTSPSPSPAPSVPDATKGTGSVWRFLLPLLLLLALLAAVTALFLKGQTPLGKALADTLRLLRDFKTTPPATKPQAPPGPATTGDSVDRNEMKSGIIGGTKRVADELQCSVFAPHEAAPGDGFLVQAFAHLAEHAPLLEALAKEADRDAARRGADKLGAIERGQELFFHLNMPGLEVDEPLQSVVWNGDIESVQFGVQVPDGFAPRRVNCKLTVSVLGVPVGHVRFVFEVVAAQPPAAAEAPPDPAGRYVRYRKGFVSYASEDLAEVLKRVQVMTQLGIDCFQDLLSLKPGERWEKKLYLRIDESDVFFLFWSEAAHRSEWVEREVRYALVRKGEDEERPPEIMPVILEGPPQVPPPSYLPEQHFNDPFALLIKAVGPPRPGKKDL